MASGAYESGGTWKYAAFWQDVDDLEIVVQFLNQQYGYVTDLLVGHSRGSVVAMLWLCTSKEGQLVGGLVNASGRYRMEVSSICTVSCHSTADTLVKETFERFVIA
jgi:alpha-beta hydrolase superfamily lysophospholipase